MRGVDPFHWRATVRHYEMKDLDLFHWRAMSSVLKGL